MIFKRAEDEVNMIPYYVLILLVPLVVIISMCWSACKERHDRKRDQERERIGRNLFGGDIELENLAKNRRRSLIPFSWVRAIIASGEELQIGGREEDDGRIVDNHVAARQDRTVNSRGEFSTVWHSREQRGFGSLESDPAGARLFGGGPVLDSDTQTPSQKSLGLTYTAQAAISTPVTREIKVYTVRLPTPALFPSLDTSLDNSIGNLGREPLGYEKAAYPYPSLPELSTSYGTSPTIKYPFFLSSLINGHPSKRYFADDYLDDGGFELEELDRSVCPSPMPNAISDSHNGSLTEYKLPAHSVLFNADYYLPQYESDPQTLAVPELERQTISFRDLQSNEVWYCYVFPEEEWILYGLGGKRGTCK